jgi:hypothetical protein
MGGWEKRKLEEEPREPEDPDRNTPSPDVPSILVTMVPVELVVIIIRASDSRALCLLHHAPSIPARRAP